MLKNWECSFCKNTLGFLVLSCVYCDAYGYRDYVFSPFINERLENPLTPQEELYADLFSHEKKLVKDMSVLELRAHREELAKIAFEARARLTAVDDEEKSRKRSENGPTGFKTSVSSDATTQNLINTVKERSGRMSKQEKLIEGLISLGYSRKDAEAKLSAGELLRKFKDASLPKAEPAKPAEALEKPNFANPFAKNNAN